MEPIWVVLSTALLLFCLLTARNIGYKAGARKVLNEWKKSIELMGDDDIE